MRHSKGTQVLKQALALDEFGHRLDAEIVAQAGEVAHQRFVGLRVLDAADEGTVDLDEIEFQLAQVVEGVVATAEIIQRKAKPFLA